MAPVPHVPALDDPKGSYHFLSLFLSQSLSYFTCLLPSLPSICRILQHWDDALTYILGQLLGGGDTLLASDNYHSRAARMQLGLPTRLGGLGVRCSRDYAAFSHITSWLACINPSLTSLRGWTCALSTRERLSSHRQPSLFPTLALGEGINGHRFHPSSCPHSPSACHTHT